MFGTYAGWSGGPGRRPRDRICADMKEKRKRTGLMEGRAKGEWEGTDTQTKKNVPFSTSLQLK